MKGKLKLKKLLQVLLKNRRVKEYKLLLCIITVAITSLTIFTALNALPLLEESLKQDLRQTTVGEADYIITHFDNELFEVFEADQAKKFDVLALNGSIVGKKNAKVTVWGADYDIFLEVFGDTYTEKGEVSYPASLKEDEVILSPKIAERLNLSNGSRVEIELYGQKLSATTIIAPKDNFFVKANEYLVICNSDVLYNILNLDRKLISLCYLYDVDKDSTIIEDLEKNKDFLYIREAIDPEYISSNMATYYGIDILIFLFILLISVDILKSTGLIYVTERSKFIGTLRSNGAEKKKILDLFSRIGLKVATTGCIVGMSLGMILVIVFAKFGISMPNPFKAIDIIFMGFAIVITLIVTVLISTMSFRKPVKQLLQKSDRSLILEDISKSMQHQVNNKYDVIYPILLILLMVLGFYISYWGVGMVLLYSAILVYILIKSVKTIFIAVTGRIRKKTGKGTLLIAAKNVSSNVYLRKTLTLTSTISLFITIIGLLIFSVLSAMTSFYQDYKADAYIRVEDGLSFQDEELKELNSLTNVTDTYQYYSGKVTINTSDEKRQVKVIGIDDPVIYDKNFLTLKLIWLEGFDPTTFKNDRNVIMSKVLCNRLGFELGDLVRLHDGSEEQSYTVVAITPSLQELGDVIYISRYDKTFCNGSIYNGIYLKGTDIETLGKSVENIFFNRNYHFKDVSEMKENDITNGMQIIIFFVAFAALVGMTSITGIYSNYKLSYMMRKQEFAVLFSAGYSRKHILKILISEISIISLIGYVASFFILWIIKKSLENLMELVELPIKLSVKGEIFLAMFLVAIVMMLINIALACKSSRISKDTVVEELKK